MTPQGILGPTQALNKIAQFPYGPSIPILNAIVKAVGFDAPLTRALVDNFRWRTDNEWFTYCGNMAILAANAHLGAAIHGAFARMYLKGWQQFPEPTQNPVRLENRCVYHKHSEGEVDMFPGKCPDEQKLGGVSLPFQL